MSMKTFPGKAWQSITPEDAGVNSHHLQKAVEWLDTISVKGYRLMIVRNGYQILDVCRGYSPAEKFSIASAAKSIYSNVLGITVDEGMLPSADVPVVEYYTEMMDVPVGTGPKDGRYAFPKDSAITFRHLALRCPCCSGCP